MLGSGFRFDYLGGTRHKYLKIRSGTLRYLGLQIPSLEELLIERIGGIRDSPDKTRNFPMRTELNRFNMRLRQ